VAKTFAEYARERELLEDRLRRRHEPQRPSWSAGGVLGAAREGRQLGDADTYEWRVVIDGDTRQDWAVSFHVAGRTQAW
jgi:hypothetical protein